MTTIKWTRAKLNRLSTKIEQELSNGASRSDTFVFDGHVVVLSYAAYLVEYLSARLPYEEPSP